jgi:hypothetical protein
MEKDLIGIGTEVVYSKNSETTKRNRKFGMIHGLPSLANIMSFGSLAMPCTPGTSPAISTCEAVTVGQKPFPCSENCCCLLVNTNSELCLGFYGERKSYFCWDDMMNFNNMQNSGSSFHF